MVEIKELYRLYQQHPCITTDSRDCPEGSIFLALKGESFDGNQFALQALEKGCAYAIIDNAQFTARPKDACYRRDARMHNAQFQDRLILVDDCLQTFKDLAREHRRRFT